MIRVGYIGVLIAVTILTLSCNRKEVGSSTKDSITHKVDSLLAIMTLEEKIGQLIQYTSRWEMTGPVPEGDALQQQSEMIKSGMAGSMLNVVGASATREAQKLAVENSRLGIPLIFGYDVIHGFQTMYPIPLGMAASWEPAVMEKAARMAAVEASASGLHWTFAPMVDIARDARWGRAMEGAGEDPFLCASMAAAAVRGFQGDDLSATNTVASCAKHFAAYGFVEAGRDYNSVVIDDATLRDVVLPPFKACVDAGAASFMNAFNTYNGIPATGSSYLQRDILKGEWGFDGVMLSDWNSIGEMIVHGVAADAKEAALLAITAGCDMDMESMAYSNHLVELVREGKVDESLINDAAGRVLRLKFKLGLFEDPYRYSNEDLEQRVIGQSAHMDVAKEAALKSIVLLKNENKILPLKKDAKIAVIGPLADDKNSPLGSWRAKAISGSAVSLLEGIRNLTTNDGNITFAKGCDLTVGNVHFRDELQYNTTDRSGFEQAIQAAKNADYVVLAIGEHAFESGEGRSKVDIRLKGLQEQLLDEVVKVNQNIIVVLSNGRALDISALSEKVPAILETWHLGSQSGHAIAEVIFGDYNPSGKLPISFPRHVGQEPLYYNLRSTGRPTGKGQQVFWSHYTDAEKTPLYPFGYGLSYTEFEYADLTAEVSGTVEDFEVSVSVEVKNIGSYAGTEVVQLYVHDPVASRARPVRELKGFEKISLDQGESKKVEFLLTPSELSFWTANNQNITEPGEFEIMIMDQSIMIEIKEK